MSLLLAIGVLVVFAVLSLVIGHAPAARTKQTILAIREKTAEFIMLSEQDGDPIIRLMHTTSALAYAEILSIIASEDNQKNILGINPYELKEEARRKQKQALVDIHKKAPNLHTTRPTLARTAGWKE
jgi:hypothetical protein